LQCVTDYCNMDKRIWDQWCWAFCWMGSKRRETCAISCGDIDFRSQHHVRYANFLLFFCGDNIDYW